MLWYTDSKNGYKWLKKGTRNSQITEQILAIKWLEVEKKIEIQPVWMSTTWEDTVKADEMSRASTSTDEWGLTEDDKHTIFQQLNIQPTTDAFASSRNSICQKFFSKGPQIGSTGINFFGQFLSPEEVYYCCPPVHEIGHTIKKLRRTKGITAVLVVPAWRSAPHWGMLRERNGFTKEVKRFVEWKPSRFVNTGSQASVFAKGASVRILAAVYCTGKEKD